MSLYKDASLVMLPSAVKDGKLYSIRPTDGDGDFTFSRGSNLAATRVDVNGIIEKGRENLFLYSQDYSQSNWQVLNATKVSTTETDPNGGSTACNITWAAGAGTKFLFQNISTGNLLCVSMYVKSNGGGNKFRLFGDGATDYSQDFTATNEWQRFEFFFERGSGLGTGIASASDNSAADLLIAFSQTEQGLVATDYIETGASTAQAGILEDMPRLDYSGGASCPALLLEPQRTNNIPYSEYQSGGGFSLGANITWNGFVESPEGVNNASRFTSTTPSACFVQIQNVTIPAGDFTFSMWVRGVSGSFVNRSMYIPSHTGTQATMNEAPVAGEDWKLVYGSGTNTSGSSYVRTITLPFYDQPASSVWEMYGFQLEAGSYPTSYIPTYGSSVTRSKDFVSLTSASDLMDVNGTTFLLEVQGISNGGDSRRFSISDGTYNNRAVIELDETADTIKVFLVGNGSVGASLTITGIDQTNNNKIAVAFDSSGVIVYINGEYKTQDTSITLPTALSEIKFRDGGGSNLEMEGYVKQAIVFSSRLTDTELASLTTL